MFKRLPWPVLSIKDKIPYRESWGAVYRPSPQVPSDQREKAGHIQKWYFLLDMESSCRDSLRATTASLVASQSQIQRASPARPNHECLICQLSLRWTGFPFEELSRGLLSESGDYKSPPLQLRKLEKKKKWAG